MKKNRIDSFTCFVGFLLILALFFSIKLFAGIQDKLAIFPDYGFKSSDTIAGTSFSGIVGGVVVILLCVVCCNLFKFFRKKA
mgnify:CR=1 FL=1